LCSLTPAAPPTTWIGTSTVISSSILTAWRSRWTRVSRTGSYWRSRTTAGRGSVSPATRTFTSTPPPAWAWRARWTSAGAPAEATGSIPAPQTAAGMSQARRNRRTGPLQKASRRWTDRSRMFIGVSLLDEQGGHRLLVVDPPDRLGEERRHRENRDLGVFLVLAEGDRVRHHDLLQRRTLDPREGGPGEDGVDAAGEDPARPLPPEGIGGLDEGARGVDQVVDGDEVAPRDVTDQVHEDGDVRAVPPLVDDGEARSQPLGDRTGALHAAGVGRDHDGVGEVALLDVLDDDGGGEEVIHRDVEEALDLADVEIEGQEPLGAGGDDEVGHQLRRDGDPRLNLAVLPGVAVVGEHGGDARGGGPLERVEHHQELHQVVVDGRASRLDQEHVGATHVLVDLDEDLAVGEARHLDLSHRNPEAGGDLLGEGPVRVAREELQLVRHGVAHSSP